MTAQAVVVAAASESASVTPATHLVKRFSNAELGLLCGGVMEEVREPDELYWSVRLDEPGEFDVMERLARPDLLLDPVGGVILPSLAGPD